MAVQQEKLSRSKEPQNHIAMQLTFWYNDKNMRWLLYPQLRGCDHLCLKPLLHTNLYRKSLGRRKTKIGRVDVWAISAILLSDAGFNSYTNTAYRNEELKSLTRYRFDKVRKRVKPRSRSSLMRIILFRYLFGLFYIISLLWYINPCETKEAGEYNEFKCNRSVFSPI